MDASPLITFAICFVISYVYSSLLPRLLTTIVPPSLSQRQAWEESSSHTSVYLPTLIYEVWNCILEALTDFIIRHITSILCQSRINNTFFIGSPEDILSVQTSRNCRTEVTAWIMSNTEIVSLSLTLPTILVDVLFLLVKVSHNDNTTEVPIQLLKVIGAEVST